MIIIDENRAGTCTGMAGLLAVTFKLTRMLTIKSQAQAGTPSRRECVQ